ncbi:MAG: tRNA (guanine-N7)-methyltransferase [Polyangiaceae bacterium]|nr:tRNA (guanine-N7)-methyltransferase [Polyangiaceae bacterium]
MRSDPYADAPRLPEGDAVDPRALVGAGSEPIELEIGPGRGWFLIERLEAEPGVRMVGLEIRRKWATIVDRRLAGRGFGDRARVFAEDVRPALARFPDASVRVAYLHFPDPWWKKRHQKRLVLTPDLCRELARVVVPGGELFVQTDVPERADDYQQVVAQEPAFAPWEGGPRVAENPYRARSPRERRAIEDGLPVVRMRWRRRSPGESCGS